MFGLCCNETYIAMTNYDDVHDNVDEDGNNDGNADSGSGSNGPIFDIITPPQSHGGGSGDDDVAVAVAHYISSRCTIYLPYKDPIKDVP